MAQSSRGRIDRRDHQNAPAQKRASTLFLRSVITLSLIASASPSLAEPPEPGPPECYGCPDGYECNAAKTKCVKSKSEPSGQSPNGDKGPTEHPAIRR